MPKKKIVEEIIEKEFEFEEEIISVKIVDFRDVENAMRNSRAYFNTKLNIHQSTNDDDCEVLEEIIWDIFPESNKVLLKDIRPKQIKNLLK